MTTCDVIVVGGGPAGSTCAKRLVEAGANVVVTDRAVFPRDQVCAGWITPAVVDLLGLDLNDYGRGRTLQPFTGFDATLLQGRRAAAETNPPISVDYGRVVSYGVRRVEFDHYLLLRSGAALISGEPVKTLRHTRGRWIVNEHLEAPCLVGAGGHWCPVARWLNAGPSAGRPIVAQEVELRLEQEATREVRVRAEAPALLFCPDLRGYGWCVRKGDYLNVGFGRLGGDGFQAALQAFLADRAVRHVLGRFGVGPMKGHAYLVGALSPRRLAGSGVLLIGDAAGLALAPSGEGILAAVESGTIAGNSVARTGGVPDRAVEAYVEAIDERFGARGEVDRVRGLPAALIVAGGRLILGSRWLTRRVVFDRAFLHTARPRLALTA